MRLLAALLVFSLLGPQAHALSCLQPNVARDFNWRQGEKETYRIFVGQVKMVGRIPKYREGRKRTAKAVTTGRFMGRTKLTETQTFELTVNTTCAASWCGGFPGKSDADSILFFEKTPKGDALNIGPCDYGLAEPVTKKKIKLLQRCLRRGKCSDADVKRLDQF
jgi:hypothetical protein